MITVKLIGGLGNQMFQYAIGRHLAIKNRKPLYVDLSLLLRRDNDINFTFRDFELDIFNTNYLILRHHNLIKKFRDFYNKISPPQYINESEHLFNKDILELRGNIYLDGFWQNENYFKEIAPVLRTDFTFKYEPCKMNQKIISQINATNSVSVHIRRGDYVTNPSANSMHYICSAEYYKKAILYFIEKKINPHFYIFSDDINWAKDNLSMFDSCTFIDFNKGKSSFEDMRLMSLCQHNIIANSSFSWWGAWLNRNIAKTVIAPQQWFKHTTTEIVPSEWIKM